MPARDRRGHSLPDSHPFKNALIEFASKPQASSTQPAQLQSEKPETEEDGIRAEALRRSKVRLMSLLRPTPIKDAPPLHSSTPGATWKESRESLRHDAPKTIEVIVPEDGVFEATVSIPLEELLAAFPPESPSIHKAEEPVR